MSLSDDRGRATVSKGRPHKRIPEESTASITGLPKDSGLPLQRALVSAEGQSRPEAREVQTKSRENSRASTATSDGQRGTIKR